MEYIFLKQKQEYTIINNKQYSKSIVWETQDTEICNCFYLKGSKPNHAFNKVNMN